MKDERIMEMMENEGIESTYNYIAMMEYEITLQHFQKLVCRHVDNKLKIIDKQKELGRTLDNKIYLEE